jgi:uncharacterized protein (TIGR02996 family)
MSGLAYTIVRAVRGLPSTMVECKRGRLWGGDTVELWQLHAEHGIASTGAPTGVEHGFVGGFGVIVLRSWWTERAGALAFRDAARDPEVASALTAMCYGRPRDTRRAQVVDLDRLFALCAAPPRRRLAMRIVAAELLRDDILDATPWLEGSSWHSGPRRERTITEAERALIAGVAAAPADEGAAVVYADWLEQQDRGDEAAALRPHAGA